MDRLDLGWLVAAAVTIAGHIESSASYLRKPKYTAPTRQTKHAT